MDVSLCNIFLISRFSGMWLMSTAPKTAAKGAGILFIFLKWLIFSLLKQQIREWRLSRLLAVETSRVVDIRCNRIEEWIRECVKIEFDIRIRGKKQAVETWEITDRRWTMSSYRWQENKSLFFRVERLPNFDNCFSIKALNGKIRKLTSWLRTSLFFPLSCVDNSADKNVASTSSHCGSLCRAVLLTQWRVADGEFGPNRSYSYMCEMTISFTYFSFLLYWFKHLQ